MRLLKILLLLQLIISLNSCGPLAYKKVDGRKVSSDPDERVAKNDSSPNYYQNACRWRI